MALLHGGTNIHQAKDMTKLMINDCGFQFTEEQKELLWKYFEENKYDELKNYFKDMFDNEIEKIKKIFEGIDVNKSGTLEPFELT